MANAGWFPKGVSGNPKGRPPGNPVNKKLRQAIAQQSDAILESLIKQALSGDVPACKVLFDRVFPVLKAEALPVHIPGMATGSLTQRAEAALNAAAKGEVSPTVVTQLIAAIAAMARTSEIEDLAKRLEVLEAVLGAKQ